MKVLRGYPVLLKINDEYRSWTDKPDMSDFPDKPKKQENDRQTRHTDADKLCTKKQRSIWSTTSISSIFKYIKYEKNVKFFNYSSYIQLNKYSKLVDINLCHDIYYCLWSFNIENVPLIKQNYIMRQNSKCGLILQSI